MIQAKWFCFAFTLGFIQLTYKASLIFNSNLESETHFLSNSKFYKQIDGVAIGSPLAPVLANLFMGFYEYKWLNEYNMSKPKFYLRYVNDILASFDKEQDSLNLSKCLNKKHPEINVR